MYNSSLFEAFSVNDQSTHNHQRLPEQEQFLNEEHDLSMIDATSEGEVMVRVTSDV